MKRGDDNGLVTNYGAGGGGGGATKWEGGACEVLPLRKGGGGGGKSFSHAEGWGTQQVLGYFLCGSLKF